MGYSLEQFAADCRAALQADPGPAGQEQCRQLVVRALQDTAFIDRHIPADGPERNVIHEDPELGFCICAHSHDEARAGTPHDHGATWAIYGQAAGETSMTDWRYVSAPEGGRPGKVELARTYKLSPGDAHLYKVGDVHAPYRDGPTRLLRIEGRNTEGIARTPVEAA